MNKDKGFTLVEIAIVVAVIGLLLAAVMSRGGFIIGNAKTNDTIALIKDLTSAINEFRGRYHYLPGDMPQAGDNITGMSTGCNIAAATANIGNGQIDTVAEVGCVAEHLVRAGLLKGNTTGLFSRSANTATPDVYFIARRSAGTAVLLPSLTGTGLNLPSFPASVVNEIMITNQPCKTAQDIDAKLDDGNFATGKIRASVTSCMPGPAPEGFNDPVPHIDIEF